MTTEEIYNWLVWDSAGVPDCFDPKEEHSSLLFLWLDEGNEKGFTDFFIDRITSLTEAYKKVVDELNDIKSKELK